MLLRPESFYDYSVEQIRREDVRAFEFAFLKFQIYLNLNTLIPQVLNQAPTNKHAKKSK